MTSVCLLHSLCVTTSSRFSQRFFPFNTSVCFIADVGAGCKLRSIDKNSYPGSAKLNDLHFHPLEVAFRYHNPQLQVAENTI